jgi:N-acetylneuraminate synthase/sialic acid synthase
MGKKLVASRDLPAGHVLTEDDIACKSPGDGLPPYYLDVVLGRRLNSALAQDADIALSLLDFDIDAVLTQLMLNAH